MASRSSKSSPGHDLSVIVLVFCCCLLASKAAAYKFYVGGRDGWVVHPSEDYNQWSGRNRFLINDILYFKYKKGEDSVLLVNQGDYDSCNTKNPVQRWDDGDTTFTLDRSGPFFFISGQDGHCRQGQKLLVVVLAVRQRPPVAPGTPPPTSGSAPVTSPPPAPATSSPPPSQTPGAKAPAPATSSPPSQTPGAMAPTPMISTTPPAPGAQAPAVTTSPPSQAPGAAVPTPATVPSTSPPAAGPGLSPPVVPGPAATLPPGTSPPSPPGSTAPSGSVSPGTPSSGSPANSTGTPTPANSSAQGIHPVGFGASVLGVVLVIWGTS